MRDKISTKHQSLEFVGREKASLKTTASSTTNKMLRLKCTTVDDTAVNGINRFAFPFSAFNENFPPSVFLLLCNSFGKKVFSENCKTKKKNIAPEQPHRNINIDLEMPDITEASLVYI